MTEILIRRFEAKAAERGLEFTVEGTGIVTITDHTTDKIIAMINLDKDVDNNMEIADSIISAIEEWINAHEN